jgi:hypothetical protein
MLCFTIADQSMSSTMRKHLQVKSHFGIEEEVIYPKLLHGRIANLRSGRKVSCTKLSQVFGTISVAAMSRDRGRVKPIYPEKQAVPLEGDWVAFSSWFIGNFGHFGTYSNCPMHSMLSPTSTVVPKSIDFSHLIHLHFLNLNHSARSFAHNRIPQKYRSRNYTFPTQLTAVSNANFLSFWILNSTNALAGLIEM